MILRKVVVSKMDISKFNKELADKITEAKILEKRGEFNSAVKVWLKISEMTLNASKSRDIEVAYKNMLVNKTQEIIEYIKSLKNKDKPAKTEIFHSAETIGKNQITTKSQGSPKIDYDQEVKKKNNLGTKSLNENNNGSQDINDSGEIEVPEGFKEISPSKDFKIITPHNPNYVKNAMDRAEKQTVFKNQENQSSPTNISSDRGTNDFNKNFSERYVICFACGFDKNPQDKKFCQNCGTKL